MTDAETDYQVLRSFLKLGTRDTERAELVRCAMQEELTPRQRQLAEMHFLRQMPVGDIALELGLSPSTVSRTLSRARKNLKKYLRYCGRNLLYLLEE